MVVERIEGRRDTGVMRKVISLLRFEFVIVWMMIAESVGVLTRQIICKAFHPSAFGTPRRASVAVVKRITPTVLCSLHAPQELLASRAYDIGPRIRAMIRLHRTGHLLDRGECVTNEGVSNCRRFRRHGMYGRCTPTDSADAACVFGRIISKTLTTL
jgi:hypothetical protein